MSGLRVILLVIFTTCAIASAAEVIPPPPARHLNDYAHIVSAATAEQLDQKLATFEKTTSNQVVVVIYPTMQSDSSIEDYTVRVAQKWGVGQKDRKNGVVLFVFPKDRKMFMQVGYGLEGALPDALAGQIIEYEIKPHFRDGDYGAGLSAGVDAIIAATKGEYTAKPQSSGGGGEILFWIILIIIVIIVIKSMSNSGPTIYTRRGRSGGIGPIIFPGGGGFGGGGGNWGGGGGGGGFSGGGGSFGGGGAGGSW